MCVLRRFPVSDWKMTYRCTFCVILDPNEIFEISNNGFCISGHVTPEDMGGRTELGVPTSNERTILGSKIVGLGSVGFRWVPGPGVVGERHWTMWQRPEPSLDRKNCPEPSRLG